MYVNEGTFNRLKETAANAIVERDQLKAENDRLIDACEEWIATSNRLDAENAKLRELLSSYWKAVHSPVTPNVPRDYLKEMRELGVVK